MNAKGRCLRLALRCGATAFVITLMVGLLVAVHGYFVSRLVRQTELGEGGTYLVIALFSLAVFQPFAERILRPGAWLRGLSWASYLWLGAAFYLVLLLGLSDLIFLISGVEPTVSVARSRALVTGAVTVGVVAAGVRGVLRPPRITRWTVSLPGWPQTLDGYRVVQLSDLHIGPILGVRFARRLLEIVHALEPQLVAITGDLVDGSVSRLSDQVAPLGDLRAPDGVWFVTGNHEMYSGCDAWVEAVEALGIRPLRNRHVLLGPAESPVVLAGVNDHRGALFGAPHGEDLEAALAGAPAGRPVVLLAHDPGTFAAAARRGVDLQISGHTHGGQMWPFGLFVRLSTPFVRGWHRRGASRLHVTNGTGFWGPPLRLGAPAEVVAFTFRAAP